MVQPNARMSTSQLAIKETTGTHMYKEQRLKLERKLLETTSVFQNKTIKEHQGKSHQGFENS